MITNEWLTQSGSLLVMLFSEFLWLKSFLDLVEMWYIGLDEIMWQSRKWPTDLVEAHIIN